LASFSLCLKYAKFHKARLRKDGKLCKSFKSMTMKALRRRRFFFSEVAVTFRIKHTDSLQLRVLGLRFSGCSCCIYWCKETASRVCSKIQTPSIGKQLLIAQAAASGEDVSARMVGKQVEEKNKNKKPRRRLHRAPASSAGASSTSASSTSATATAFFSPSASVSSATVSFPTTTKGRRIKRKHDNGSGSVLQ
jgi:hypothetical protein